MPPNLTADDLKPLVQKLTREEQLRLARMALGAATVSGADAASYLTSMPGRDEFGEEPDGGDSGLGWEGGGWEEFDAAR
jgi:hypothetical protein